VILYRGGEEGTTCSRADARASLDTAGDNRNKAQASVWVLFYYSGCLGDWKQWVSRNEHEKQAAT